MTQAGAVAQSAGGGGEGDGPVLAFAAEDGLLTASTRPLASIHHVRTLHCFKGLTSAVTL
jgi:hypothetical protein